METKLSSKPSWVSSIESRRISVPPSPLREKLREREPPTTSRSLLESKVTFSNATRELLVLPRKSTPLRTESEWLTTSTELLKRTWVCGTTDLWTDRPSVMLARLFGSNSSTTSKPSFPLWARSCTFSRTREPFSLDTAYDHKLLISCDEISI